MVAITVIQCRIPPNLFHYNQLVPSNQLLSPTTSLSLYFLAPLPADVGPWIILTIIEDVLSLPKWSSCSVSILVYLWLIIVLCSIVEVSMGLNGFFPSFHTVISIFHAHFSECRFANCLIFYLGLHYYGYRKYKSLAKWFLWKKQLNIFFKYKNGCLN